MSCWTYVTGWIECNPFGKTQEEKEYVECISLEELNRIVAQGYEIKLTLSKNIFSTLLAMKKYKIKEEIKAKTYPTKDLATIRPITFGAEKTLIIKNAVATGIPFFVKYNKINGGRTCHQ